MRGKRVGGAQRWAVAWLGLLGIGFGVVLAQTPRVATTRADFYMYGTQPSPTTLEAARWSRCWRRNFAPDAIRTSLGNIPTTTQRRTTGGHTR